MCSACRFKRIFLINTEKKSYPTWYLFVVGEENKGHFYHGFRENTKIKSNKLKVIETILKGKGRIFTFVFTDQTPHQKKKTFMTSHHYVSIIFVIYFIWRNFKPSANNRRSQWLLFFFHRSVMVVEELEEMPTKSNTLNWRCTTQFKGEKQSTNLIITRIHNVHFLHWHIMNVSGEFFSWFFQLLVD